VLGALASCQLNSESGPTSDSSLTTDLYMTDTNTGKVFTYNPSNHTVSSTSIVTTAPAAGPIYFYKGLGYIAVGSTGTNVPGVYYFNPLASVPTAVLINGSVSAQYIAFYSPTQAFVSVANYGGTGGVYTFNPSNPSAGLSSTPIMGTDGTKMYLQQIVVGPDNMIYVADFGNYSSGGVGTPQVIKINPSTNALSFFLTSSGAGTTALASGSYLGNMGVFVGNNPSGGTGSVEFFNTSTQSMSPIPLLSSTSAFALLYLSSGGGELVTASSNSTLLSNTNGTPALTTLNAPGGGSAVAAQNGLIYVGFTNYVISNLYVFDTTGVAQTFSGMQVMGSNNWIAGLGFYQN